MNIFGLGDPMLNQLGTDIKNFEQQIRDFETQSKFYQSCQVTYCRRLIGIAPRSFSRYCRQFVDSMPNYYVHYLSQLMPEYARRLRDELRGFCSSNDLLNSVREAVDKDEHWPHRGGTGFWNSTLIRDLNRLKEPIAEICCDYMPEMRREFDKIIETGYIPLEMHNIGEMYGKAHRLLSEAQSEIQSAQQQKSVLQDQFEVRKIWKRP